MVSQITQPFKEKGAQIILEPNFDEILNGLMQNLGSVDSEIRESSLDILWELLESAEMPGDKMVSMGSLFVDNLSKGVGEKGTDSVFLRTFSVLLIGVIIVQDEIRDERGESFLSEDIFTEWFDACKTYVRLEKDFRGFVPGKGWAHSVSHGADALRDFAFHRLTTAEQHREILQILAGKLMENNEEININNDDNRMARVVVTIMLRNQLDICDYEKWLEGLLAGFHGSSLLDYAGDRQKVIPWFNCISFLRALYFVLLNGMKILQDADFYRRTPPLQNEVMRLVLNTLKKMDGGLNYRF